ncbi:MAG: tetratricopeptide repeat protein, partial [Anaerolineae bacterium]
MADDLLQQGIAALRAGDKAQARQLFSQAIRQDPRNEQAWLWLSGALETTQDKLMCLNKVLVINPANEAAQRGIAALQKSSVAPSPAPLSPLQTPVPQHIRPSVVQAVLGTGSPAAEKIPALATTEPVAAATANAATAA